MADLAEGTILASVTVAAPAARVFAALTSHEVVEWWGAEDTCRTTSWTGQRRPGGRWQARGTRADRGAFAVEGEYLEVDPDRRIVSTWQADGEAETTRVTCRLEPLQAGTLLTLQHTGFRSRESCTDHAEGWAIVLEWLARHVAPEPSPPPRRYFLVRLLPPRPTFMVDMSADERRVMGEHGRYWRTMLAEGVAVGFGPVLDPSGAWGVGLLEVDDETALETLKANDPAIVGGIGMRYEVLPMARAVVRPMVRP